MTFVIHAAVGGKYESLLDYGVDNGWGGTRTTSAFVNKFEDPSGATDNRAMFYTSGKRSGYCQICQPLPMATQLQNSPIRPPQELPVLIATLS